MHPPLTLTFDLLTLKSVWESHVTWGTPVQSFVFLGLLVFELEPMYATSDRQTNRRTDGRTDGRTTDADDRLMPPPPTRRGHNKSELALVYIYTTVEFVRSVSTVRSSVTFLPVVNAASVSTSELVILTLLWRIGRRCNAVVSVLVKTPKPGLNTSKTGKSALRDTQQVNPLRNTIAVK